MRDKTEFVIFELYANISLFIGMDTINSIVSQLKL